MSAADAPAVLRLIEELYEHEGIPFREEAARAALDLLLDDHSLGAAFLLGLDAAPAGYMILTFGFSLEFHGRFALIDELFVRERHRGAGLGMVALEAAAEFCRRHAIKALRLEVAHANSRAHKFYARAGFVSDRRDLMTKWL